ncbi:magnesium/cobalt transporter CorA [Candidatus Woesearchaeota archaeon]|nr:magnesium/cobalt transporter CorA [Candidatus Woesearchaeota archaeon]
MAEEHHEHHNFHQHVKITIIDYDKKHVLRKEIRDPKECFPFRDRPTVTWINIDGIHRLDVNECIGKHFNLHPLVLEDLTNVKQRPKLEDFDSYIFLILKMIYFDAAGEIQSEQVSIILGRNFVISFQETEGFDVFGPIRERINNSKGRHRRYGADYLLYTLIDAIVDNYFTILEKLGEKIEVLEEEMIRNPHPQTYKHLHSLKNHLFSMRRSVWPVREVITALENTDNKLIHEKTKVYLRDAYDHAVQAIDNIESHRETISGVLDLYLSGLNYRLQYVVKVLTLLTTITTPFVVIASIYGMNFKNMPELDWQYGYPLSIILMGTIATVMAVYFWKKKWMFD